MLIEVATEDDVSGLAVLLLDAVAGGACLGFLAGVTLADAEAFWRESLRGADTWVARAGQGAAVVGVVQLHRAKLPNGRHRAEIAKLIVHRSARQRGLALQLMRIAEQSASSQGRWLLQLDTETGSPAEQFYARSGWQVVGVIPEHAVRPDGVLAPTTFLYKRLEDRSTA